MDIKEIQARYNNLNHDLRAALSTMEKSDSIFVIRQQIKELQALCPHDDGSFDFTTKSSCPFCGKHF